MERRLSGVQESSRKYNPFTVGPRTKYGQESVNDAEWEESQKTEKQREWHLRKNVLRLDKSL